MQLPLEPFTLVIELDAWNIRERDAWGQSAAQRARGEEPPRWHWVYGGTCFRLKHRGETAGGRATILSRGYVMTRGGIEALREQIWAEASRRGLGRANEVLIVADGAVWIPWHGSRLRRTHERRQGFLSCRHGYDRDAGTRPAQGNRLFAPVCVGPVIVLVFSDSGRE
ncbi:MAG: hypothetical protein HY736_23565 [Verrucomicrobia bacterium]|nr:hypothetical protein [Verrucomicrobiota bacterium]